MLVKVAWAAAIAACAMFGVCASCSMNEVVDCQRSLATWRHQAQ